MPVLWQSEKRTGDRGDLLRIFRRAGRKSGRHRLAGGMCANAKRRDERRKYRADHLFAG